MTSPSFRCERVDGDEYSVILHYHSLRDGLWPLTISILETAAKLVYDDECTVKHVAKRGDDQQFHDEFLLTVKPKSQQPEQAIRQRVSTMKNKFATSWRKGGLSKQNTDYLFPWHIEFDKDFKVTSVGNAVERFIDVVQGQTYLKDIVSIVRPAVTGAYTFDQILRQRHNAFLLAIVDGSTREDSSSNSDTKMEKRQLQSAKGGRHAESGELQSKPRLTRGASRAYIEMQLGAPHPGGVSPVIPETTAIDPDFKKGKCPIMHSHGIVGIKAHDDA